MREQIRRSGSRHVEEIASNSRSLVEKALYMRCQSYLAHVKAQLLTQTIFEVERNRKELKNSNIVLHNTVEELAASRARMQAVFDNKLVGLLITDLSGCCLQANARAAEILGRSVEELNAGTYKLPPMLQTGEEVRGRLLRENVRGYHVEQQFTRTDESSAWVDMSVTALSSDYGSDRFLLVLLDITEQKKAEQERITLQEQFLRVQKLEALAMLTGGIAHDFNNILAGMFGLMELLRDCVAPGSEGQEYLGELAGAGKRASDLVGQILSFSRQAPMKKQLVDPVRLSEEALKFLRASIPSTIEIRKKLNPDSGSIIADPTQLHQVLLNLGTNAAHAMSAHGGVLEVQVEPMEIWENEGSTASLSPPGSYVRIVVSDTGAGIAPEITNRIFDPYFTTKSAGEGSGLGLAVVHGIVTSLGGSIRVESELGKGTRFEILLPRAASDEPPRTEGQRSHPRGSERILIIDDEMIIAQNLGRFLGNLGYKVVVATKAEEGWREALKRPFDLVLCDHTMPTMTGIDLAQKLQHSHNSPKIVLMTGNEARVDAAAAREAGVSDILLKPMDMGELAAAIRRILAKG